MTGKIGDQLAAVGGVDDLGVELDAVEAATLVGDDRIGRAIRRRDRGEAGRERVDLVAVAHPHLVALAFRPQSVEQRAGGFDLDECLTKLAAIARNDDIAAKLRAHQLLAVADAKHRHAGLEEGLRRARAVAFGDRGGAAGQNDALGLQPLIGRFGGLERRDLAIHPSLADPAGDQLGHLAAEIDDEDGVRVLHVGVRD